MITLEDGPEDKESEGKEEEVEELEEWEVDPIYLGC